ncbi:MAG: DUF2169 domain-containing protein [Deltaproteobacteria bacterium]|nr:DUF2169 domain-containing protein [Deltaproteobacteria bacterium]
MPREQVKIIELSPTKTATLLWQPETGPAVLTVVCKATYELKPGVALLAEAQDDVNERDLHSENNPKLGLHSASDLVPFKRKADVTVVGKAFSPPGELADKLVARVRVGTVDKRIEVHAERYLTADGKLKADAFFSKMPIGYERAAGGRGTINPVGRSLSGPLEPEGRRVLPNVVVPGERISGHGAVPAPTGLGPIPATWPSRRQLLGGESAEWQGNDWRDKPVPAGVNWDFFNVAPPDQQLDEIRPDEKIHLEHLHPDEPQLDTRLPGLRPCVFIQRAKGAEQVALKGDTLWIDTNRLVQTVTWRGQVTLDDPDEALQVIVALAQPNQDLDWEQVWQAAHRRRRYGAAEEAASEASVEASVEPSVEASVEPEEKTRVRVRKTRPEAPAPLSTPHVTSPVPLVPSSDCAPEWLPTPSSSGGVVIHGQVADSPAIELPLGEADAQRLNELCLATGKSPVELLTELLRDGHNKRFG